MQRKSTRQVMVGNVPIGGGAPVSVQTMTNTDTRDYQATLAQIDRLSKAGCQIVRVSVFDDACIPALKRIRAGTKMPLVADVHFDHTLAIRAVEAGVEKLRVNPGNIGGETNVRALVACCKAHHVPIRIGVNSGSLQKDLLDKYGGPTPEGMVESALQHVRLLEKEGFTDIVLSLKSSSVEPTVECYRRMSKVCDYPMHIGVTETGSQTMGSIKSSIGVGALLLDGIGDTMRISLTADPVEEVELGRNILRALGLLRDKIEIISCPTCGRCRIDVAGIVRQVEERLRDVDRPYKIAIMGCVVNGPGEAREADFGIAGGAGAAAFFRKGQPPARIEGENLVEHLIRAIEEDMHANPK